MAPPQARHLIDRAIRIARAERTVTCVIVPNDVQEAPCAEPPREHGAMYSSAGYTEPRVIPPRATTSSAPPTSSTPARRWRCWSAQGATDAADEVIEIAELLGAGIAKALNGRCGRCPTTCRS